MISKLVSGGQTGADRAALDFAIEHNIPHGGWCPKGRRAEDGPIDARYLLTETPTANYLQRTEWNVRDSDGTVIFTMSPKLTGGSKKTAEFAKKHKKPCLHVYIPPECFPCSGHLAMPGFIRKNKIKILNVAGSRASKNPEIGDDVKKILDIVMDMLNPRKKRGYCLRLRDAVFCGVTGTPTEAAIAEANAFQAECRVLSILKNPGYEARYLLDKERKPTALEITIPQGKDPNGYPEEIERLIVRPAQEPDGHLILTVELNLKKPDVAKEKEDKPSPAP